MEKQFVVEMPKDDEGFSDFQCPKCDKYFKLKVEEIDRFEKKNNSKLKCVYCGLDSENFCTKEFKLLAENIVENYVMKEISNVFPTNVKSMKKLPEEDIPLKQGAFETIILNCCKRKVKIDLNSSNSIYFCPYCGGVEN